MKPAIEAINQAKEYMQHPHQQLAYIRTVQGQALDLNLVTAENIEASKPKRYAALAATIGVLLTETLDQRAHRPPVGLVSYPVEHEGPWQHLQAWFSHTLRSDIKNIRGSTAYQYNEMLSLRAGYLDPSARIRLDRQLEAGIITASSTIFSLLRDFPEMVHYHEPKFTPTEVGHIARHSLNIPTKLARLSINGMLAARAAIAMQPHDDLFDKIHDPTKFTAVHSQGKLTALKLEDVENLPLSADTSIHREIDSLGPFNKVGDVPDVNLPVIGCPITLLPGMLNKLWQWSIDIVEQRKLWPDS